MSLKAGRSVLGSYSAVYFFPLNGPSCVVICVSKENKDIKKKKIQKIQPFMYLYLYLYLTVDTFQKYIPQPWYLMYLLYLTLKTENEVHHRLATISVTIFDIMY